MIDVSTGGRCCLTLTRGTLKATGSMVDLVSISATAISTSRTLHSVLGRKAKPWTKDKWKEDRDMKETFWMWQKKKRAQYLVRFSRAETAAVQEVRIFSDDLINEDSVITLETHWAP